jgi:hypothetical protein
MVETPELVTAHAYKTALDAEIEGRLHDRRWYRERPWTLDWPVRAENEVALRALIRVARDARRIARPAIERADPISAYQGWTESEKAYTR